MSTTAAASVDVPNRLGMHARPATILAETAGQYACAISVRRDDGGESVDAKSIMQLMMLAATQGTTLIIEASGDGAQDAVTRLVELVGDGFNE